MEANSFPLLRLLADGEWHSAQDLERSLGIPSASVAKHIRALGDLGVAAVEAPGKGYRLAQPVDLLDRDTLAALLGDRAPRIPVEIVDECASTNAVLLERARREPDAAGSLRVLVCERQTAGRGRRGAQWLSGIGTSLTLSLQATFPRAAALSGLSLAVAVAVARALDACGVSGVQVKWPNDLLLSGAKLGGILVELTGGGQGPGTAVIGIGLNVSLPPGLRERLPNPAADLASAWEKPVSRTALLAEILIKMDDARAEFSRSGFAGFRDEWLRRHAYQGRRVALRVSERAVAEGEAVGIAEDGALLLRSARGVERFHSGEVSLRPA